MGSIGDTFPYAAPVNGTAGWANWIAVTDELITRVSSPVPISALSGSTLPMDGNEITHLKDIVFDDQTSIPTTNPGGMYYYNDEWYLVTTTGAIQVTVGGLLNVTVNGGISGDYGGVNPAAVRFVDADHRYEFYDDYSTTAWAYLKSLGLDIVSASTPAVKARIVCDSAVNLTFTMPTTLPAANTSAVQINLAGTLNHNSSTAPISNILYLDTGIGIKVGTTPIVFSTTRVCTARQVGAGWSEGDNGIQATGVGQAFIVPLPELTIPGKLNSVTIAVSKASAAAQTFTLYKRVYGAAAVSIGSVSSSVAGNQTLVINPAIQTTAHGTTYTIQGLSVAAGDLITTVCANIDIV